METTISFFRRFKTLFLAYTIPFSMMIFGTAWFCDTVIVKNISNLLDIKPLNLFLVVAMIPWLFITEHPLYRKMSVVSLFILLSPFNSINKWFSHTGFAQYLANVFHISSLTILLLLICTVGVLFQKTRLLAMLMIILVMIYTISFRFFI